MRMSTKNQVILGTIIGLPLSIWLFIVPHTPSTASAEDEARQAKIDADWKDSADMNMKRFLWDMQGASQADWGDHLCHRLREINIEYDNAHDKKDSDMVLQMQALNCN